MSVYKLYSASIGDGAASIDVVKNGRIEAIHWAARADLDADGESFDAELSFSSSSGLATNDTKSSISTIRMQNGLLTSGAIASAVNQWQSPMDVAVVEGERLYLHTAGTAIVCTVYVWVNDGLDIAGRARRTRL